MGEPLYEIYKNSNRRHAFAWVVQRTFDLTTFFSFQRTICNPKGAIFQGGLIKWIHFSSVNMREMTVSILPG